MTSWLKLRAWCFFSRIRLFPSADSAECSTLCGCPQSLLRSGRLLQHCILWPVLCPVLGEQPLIPLVHLYGYFPLLLPIRFIPAFPISRQSPVILQNHEYFRSLNILIKSHCTLVMPVSVGYNNCISLASRNYHS